VLPSLLWNILRLPATPLAVTIAILIALPVLVVGSNLFFGGTGDTWAHLLATVLPEYVSNTLWLCLGVGSGVMLVGTGTAWLTAMHDFPGRRVFEWALVIPLAMPAYVMAYTYTDLLQFVGPVQTSMREAFGWQYGDYWFPDVRSLGGAIILFVCVLYPYVYLLARTVFLERAGSALEAARSLGLSPWESFWRVSLPLARPALAAGIALALMETLADYGTVAYFGVNTFTTGIYRTWFALGDRTAAAQLAGCLFSFVLLLLALERLSRGRARFGAGAMRSRSVVTHRLRGASGWLASAFCLLPLIIGFLLPAGILMEMALTEGDAQFGERFVVLARNSMVLAGVASIAAVLLAALLAYAARRSKRWLPHLANRIVSLGYAVPGSVIAVGVLIPVTRLDHLLSDLWQSLTGNNPGLILTGGIAALVYAYLVRFLGMALQTVEAGLAKVTPSMDDAAKSLGCAAGETLRRVHLPILRGSLFTAGLLVFVDVMKELPATLVMRPFNFDTLATQTYILAADERLTEASTAALTIVVVGMLPLIALSRQIAKGRRH
jgi:iron(III) transport system permease protein